MCLAFWWCSTAWLPSPPNKPATLEMRRLTRELISRNLAESEANALEPLFQPGMMFLLQISSTPACPGLESSFRICRAAQSSISVANLWRLQSRSLATGTMRLGPMCDLSVFILVLFQAEAGAGRANSIDCCPVPCLKSPHMTIRSCVSVSLWLVRLAWCNHHLCAVYSPLVFSVSSLSSPSAHPSAQITS